jgi:hypothetical protein
MKKLWNRIFKRRSRQQSEMADRGTVPSQECSEMLLRLQCEWVPRHEAAEAIGAAKIRSLYSTGEMRAWKSRSGERFYTLSNAPLECVASA